MCGSRCRFGELVTKLLLRNEFQFDWERTFLLNALEYVLLEFGGTEKLETTDDFSSTTDLSRLTNSSIGKSFLESPKYFFLMIHRLIDPQKPCVRLMKANPFQDLGL